MFSKAFVPINSTRAHQDLVVSKLGQILITTLDAVTIAQLAESHQNISDFRTQRNLIEYHLDPGHLTKRTCELSSKLLVSPF